MRLLVSLGLLITATACSSPAPEAAAPASPAATPVAGVDDAADALRGELARSQDEILQLKHQLGEQQGQLEAAYADAERYQAGLDKCVAKLNEVSAEAGSLAEYRPAAPAPRRRQGTARVYTLGAPTVSIVDDSALVTVRLWNAGDGEASGQVTLELICGGSIVDSASQYADITPRTDQVVTATLRTTGADGTCSARAALDF